MNMSTLHHRWKTALPLWILLLVSCTGYVQADADELLQKAIYTEETVGNIDDAIKLYEQVIAEAKNTRRSAAQAQYRLGLCYQKQQKDSLAATAFKAVVEKYADQSEIVTLARKQLSKDLELLPVPWKAGEELQFSMKLANGTPIGKMIYRMDLIQHNGKSVWKCTTRGLTTIAIANHSSEVLCDNETFKPIQSFWRHSMLGVAKANYSSEEAVIDLEGKKEPVKIAYDHTVLWDNEQCFQLFRRLPLEVGYKTTLSILSSLGGQVIPLEIEVTAKETLEVLAGKFECNKVELRLAANQFQTFWLSADEHRYVVRFEAGGASIDLSLVDNRALDATTAVKIVGASCQLPKGWIYETLPDDESRGIKKVALMDPQGTATAEIATGPLSAFKMDKNQSPRMIAEEFIKETQEKKKDYVVRGPGVQDRTVNGKEAAIFVADYQQQGKAMTVYSMTIRDGDRSVNMRSTSLKSDFESLLADLNAIVDSIKSE